MSKFSRVFLTLLGLFLTSCASETNTPFYPYNYSAAGLTMPSGELKKFAYDNKKILLFGHEFTPLNGPVERTFFDNKTFSQLGRDLEGSQGLSQYYFETGPETFQFIKNGDLRLVYRGDRGTYRYRPTYANWTLDGNRLCIKWHNNWRNFCGLVGIWQNKISVINQYNTDKETLKYSWIFAEIPISTEFPPLNDGEEYSLAVSITGIKEGIFTTPLENMPPSRTGLLAFSDIRSIYSIFLDQEFGFSLSGNFSYLARFATRVLLNTTETSVMYVQAPYHGAMWTFAMLSYNEPPTARLDPLAENKITCRTGSIIAVRNEIPLDEITSYFQMRDPPTPAEWASQTYQIPSSSDFVISNTATFCRASESESEWRAIKVVGAPPAVWGVAGTMRTPSSDSFASLAAASKEFRGKLVVVEPPPQSLRRGLEPWAPSPAPEFDIDQYRRLTSPATDLTTWTLDK